MTLEELRLRALDMAVKWTREAAESGTFLSRDEVEEWAVRVANFALSGSFNGDAQ